MSAPVNAVFSGSPQGVTVAPATGITGTGGITVYYVGANGTTYAPSLTAPTNAGTYGVIIDVAAGPQYGAVAGLTVGSYSIAKANPSYQAPTAAATYGDKLSAASLPSGWAWQDAGASVGTAGQRSFNATFTPSDTVNYNSVSGIAVTVKVVKKAVTVTADDQTKYVNASDPVLTYTVAPALVAGDTLAGSLKYDGTDVGVHDIVEDVPFSNPNYHVTFVPGTMTIEEDASVQAVIDMIDALPGTVSTVENADAVANATNRYAALPLATRQSPDVQAAYGRLLTAQLQAATVNHAGLGTGSSGSNAVLPWNVRLTSTTIGASDGRYADFQGKLGDRRLVALFDVSLTDTLTNDPYALSANTAIAVEIKGLALAGATGVSVSHLKSDGTLETVATTATSDSVTFTATSFSPYGITAQPPAVAVPLTQTGATILAWPRLLPVSVIAGIFLIVTGIGVLLLARSGRFDEDEA